MHCELTQTMNRCILLTHINKANVTNVLLMVSSRYLIIH